MAKDPFTLDDANLIKKAVQAYMENLTIGPELTEFGNMFNRLEVFIYTKENEQNQPPSEP